MIVVKLLHPRATPDHVGIIPAMLSERDPRPARYQLNDGYSHGGGWHPFDGFELRPDDSIAYPGDPVHKPLAEMKLRDERILIYAYGWVAIIQPDRTFEICRMD